MSHHIYTTDAYVFKHEFRRDADSFIYLFTKDLGYIRAVATGSRHEKSKHRFALQDYSHCTVSLVKGKAGWRITSAVPHINIHTELYHDAPELFLLFARVIKTIQRLIQGEEGDVELFTIVHHAIQFGLDSQKQLHAQPEYGEMFELVFLVHVLSHLGYATVPSYILDDSGDVLYSIDMCKRLQKYAKELTAMINTALAQSHL